MPKITDKRHRPKNNNKKGQLSKIFDVENAVQARGEGHRSGFFLYLLRYETT